ncbi:acetylornithine deacetylase [Tatumella citrea]|uniref:Acetylornithine deacetylase (ArgE) n=1 Tax=Tatumella citrea TaxID=53336 RepID=A0A1Y0LB10_TATCI|nr:acetylornithine deacetylase [Tatumella citrea]ARU95256.1 acetylornithine deacetylase (ArgE) [Tatumella citrea]ARU99296.1 acetylornithine deacetylase (ArgE) [Tatumella citrea]
MSDATRDWLARLLSFDTTSRESNLRLIEAIAGYLTELGIEHQLIYNDDRSKANLHARLGPAEDGGVMLSGHTDVVPVDGQNWTTEPFALTERDGRYYGRGSADMKGFIACVLAALPGFLARPLRLPLHLAFSYDEEVGCLGVRSLIEMLNSSPQKPGLCIVGEPTEMQPVFGHKGKIAMRCHVQGHACHSAYAPEGVNAIEYASKIIHRMGEVAEQLTLEQDTRFSPAFSTLQTGVIRGGNALNIVPRECQFDFELRHLPDQPAEQTIRSITDFAQQQLLPKMRAVSDQCDITFTPLSQYPGLCTDPQSDIARWVSEWCGHSTLTTVPYGTEGGLFDEAGIATMVCGPGCMDQGHKADEFVAIEQLAQCSAMLDKLCQWMRSDS